MYLFHGIAELRNYLGDLVPGPKLSDVVFGLFECFVEVLIGGAFADEHDVFLVVEVAVEFGDVGVVEAGLNFELVDHILLDFHFLHFLFLQYF
jgi:hypothetical protein